MTATHKCLLLATFDDLGSSSTFDLVDHDELRDKGIHQCQLSRDDVSRLIATDEEAYFRRRRRGHEKERLVFRYLRRRQCVAHARCFLWKPALDARLL